MGLMRRHTTEGLAVEGREVERAVSILIVLLGKQARGREKEIQRREARMRKRERNPRVR
jgi:hypothetical protein